MGQNIYSNFSDLLDFFRRKRKECPKGVTLKLKANKYLVVQFVSPSTNKLVERKVGAIRFDEENIILAIGKARKIRDALDNLDKASDFWQWYDEEILEINRIKSDLKTYREIFSEVEEEYFNGHHKNTKRKRSRESISDQNSFNRTKGVYIKKFKSLDKYPDWSEIRGVLYSWPQGTKSFKDAYYFLKDIARRSGKKDVLEAFSDINPAQTIFSDRQSCSWDDFKLWFLNTKKEIDSISVIEYKVNYRSWLWVSAMCTVYGLRPSEIAAAQNLTTDWKSGHVTIPAINSPNNENLLLVIGEFTYFGTSTKTGSRICKPMITDKILWDDLNLRTVLLPEYHCSSSKPEVIARGFSDRLIVFLKKFNAPVTQAYALRHLANQLGEKYGIPQEIRARTLGHSVAVNEKVYKSRTNLGTEIDLLLNHNKQAVDYDLAIEKIKNSGIEIDSTIEKVLKIIYE